MGKKPSLKAQLRSADRRRKRRSKAGDGSPCSDKGHPGVYGIGEGKADVTTADSESGTHNPSATSEATDLIASAILEHIQQLGFAATDTVVLSALRAVLRGSPPNKPEAIGLYEKLNEIGERSKVEPRNYRKGVESLLQLAREQGEMAMPDAFLQYLSILST